MRGSGKGGPRDEDGGGEVEGDLDAVGRAGEDLADERLAERGAEDDEAEAERRLRGAVGGHAHEGVAEVQDVKDAHDQADVVQDAVRVVPRELRPQRQPHVAKVLRAHADRVLQLHQNEHPPFRRLLCFTLNATQKTWEKEKSGQSLTRDTS